MFSDSSNMPLDAPDALDLKLLGDCAPLFSISGQVYGSLFSLTSPTPPDGEPYLVAYSPEVCRWLDFCSSCRCNIGEGDNMTCVWRLCGETGACVVSTPVCSNRCSWSVIDLFLVVSRASFGKHSNGSKLHTANPRMALNASSLRNSRPVQTDRWFGSCS